MPLYHAAAIDISLQYSLYMDTGIALGMPNRPLTADNVLEYLKYCGADSVMLPPSIMEDLSVMPEGIEALKKLSYAAFAGG